MPHRIPVSSSNVPTVSGTSEADYAWTAWQETMQEYKLASSDEVNDDTLSKLDFWILISLPADSYSEQLQWHEDLPMLVPAPGTGKLVGLAKSRDELLQMLDNDRKNVHLIYKVKLQGRKAWNSLLNFLGTHDMLEREN